MTKPLRRIFALVALVLAVAPQAQAHPGHDGHELTWDFSHLVEHPVATLLCLSVLAAAAWGFWRLARGAVARRPVSK